MITFCIVAFIEALGLLLLIANQRKFEKKCKEDHREPAVNIIFAYLIFVVFPTIVVLLMGE
jgi:preprotein translocase subunit SecY